MTLYSGLCAFLEKNDSPRDHVHSQKCELAEIPVEGLITDFIEWDDGGTRSPANATVIP